ncbi:MAG TPA: AgmX/PglI C-terminal domain-containing protein [Polyangia bacterium]|nr:AgmX/PglI C-terminal domain-containing protein [Polyangia bacterium]
MRKAWGLVVVMAMFGACAEQSGSTQQQSTMAGSQEQGGSAVDPNALTPERQDAIERTFQRKAGSLQDCWSKEYEKTKDRKFEDDITVGFEIEPSGNPTNVRILKATGNNHDVESCVMQEIAQWSFPEGNAKVPYMRTVHLGAEF